MDSRGFDLSPSHVGKMQPELAKFMEGVTCPRKTKRITIWKALNEERSFRDEEDAAYRREDDRCSEGVGGGKAGQRGGSGTGVADQTLYNWKSKYGGMEVGDAKRLKALEDENRRLKEMVADLSLDKEALKAVIRKNGWSL